jgi:ribose 5-phosphate isomerase A
MVVGLGTGDTAAQALKALGERVRAGLSIRGVPTSRASAELARQEGIPLIACEQVSSIDLTIDGADEIDPELRLIKGAGGALTREKVVARASRVVAIVADAAKRVSKLGENKPLPVEIVSFCETLTLAALRRLGLEPTLRMAAEAPVVSDNGGLLVDCALPAEFDAADLGDRIKRITGVIEHGLFLTEASLVLVGYQDRVEVLRRA